MKCRIPTKTELIQKQIDREQQKCAVRVQYFMFLAFNRALGIGAQRFDKVLTEYNNVLKWYEDAKKDGVEEIKLKDALKSIGLPIDKLYGELEE